MKRRRSLTVAALVVAGTSGCGFDGLDPHGQRGEGRARVRLTAVFADDQADSAFAASLRRAAALGDRRAQRLLAERAIEIPGTMAALTDEEDAQFTMTTTAIVANGSYGIDLESETRWLGEMASMVATTTVQWTGPDGWSEGQTFTKDFGSSPGVPHYGGYSGERKMLRSATYNGNGDPTCGRWQSSTAHQRVAHDARIPTRNGESKLERVASRGR